MELYAAPYPIVPSPLGTFRTVGAETGVKGDLLQLILTNPGERVMLPDFGTPLRRLLFEQNSDTLKETARSMILESIRKWEPRILVRGLNITTTTDSGPFKFLAPNPDVNENDYVLLIKLEYSLLNNLSQINNLVLSLPLNGATNA